MTQNGAAFLLTVNGNDGNQQLMEYILKQTAYYSVPTENIS